MSQAVRWAGDQRAGFGGGGGGREWARGGGARTRTHAALPIPAEPVQGAACNQRGNFMTIRPIIGLAACAAALSLAGAAQAAPGDYVAIVQETAINAPAATAWAKLKGYCDIGKWLNPAAPVPCEVTAGKDGELGALRKIAGRVEEVIVAVTPMSYTYADINPAILYHGTVEIRPVDKKTSKLIYSLLFDQTSIAVDQRAANRDRRQKMFAGAMAVMKGIAEAK